MFKRAAAFIHFNMIITILAGKMIFYHPKTGSNNDPGDDWLLSNEQKTPLLQITS